MSREERRVNALRELIAEKVGERPPWIDVVYQHSFLGDRIDVVVRWIAPNKECHVHTDARTGRGAIRQVHKMIRSHDGSAVKPGRRFWVDSPDHYEEK